MDIEHIKSLVELMVANDLNRLEISEGETHILLRRGQPVVMTAAPVAAPLVAPAGQVAAAPPAAAGAPATPSVAPASPAGDETLIRSPMVGTFYTSSDPETPAFVQVGDVIGPDTVVCLVEAMKVFNEIKAETSGRIVRVLAKNAQAVEYDQPLFALAPA